VEGGAVHDDADLRRRVDEWAYRIAGQRIGRTLVAAGAVAVFCIALPELLRRLPPDVRADFGDPSERNPDPAT
jgi:hypothetical protein